MSTGRRIFGVTLDRDAEIPRRPLRVVVPVRESARLPVGPSCALPPCAQIRVVRLGDQLSPPRRVFAAHDIQGAVQTASARFQRAARLPKAVHALALHAFKVRVSLRRARRASGRPCPGDEPEPLVEAGKRSRQPSVVKRKCLTAWAAPGILFSSNDEVCAVIR